MFGTHCSWHNPTSFGYAGTRVPRLTFPGRWIGRDGQMPWHITPLDFFLWGYVKSSVFRTSVNGLDELKTRIRNSISATPADLLHRTWQELGYRLDVLRATTGAHNEVY
ncbi:hypothetical protein B7P43_G03471 [Cryptotermes secundus]|uniref:Uncharacterized protein n=1 Tax=Cryptotermes secundus TaxID=105785 RepID=A0A2J7QIA6_9NEOP|nr:hypothetical protein B7P43_G03471 [Cryptotermes secundus]